MEHDPDKRRANRDKQARHVKGIGRTPTPALQARMDALFHRVASGMTITAACAQLGMARATYEQWRHRFPSYAHRIDRAKAKHKPGAEFPPCPFTPEFRETYLRWDYPDDPVNPPHLLQAMELINKIGPGEFGLILMPPGHAKSSMSEDLLTTVIANDPESRCVLISKTQDEAVKRLLKVQARMEEIDFYEDFITEWGPFKPEGRSGRPWSSRQFTVLRKSFRQRDYSLQAIGIAGVIQGQSIDWAVLDDIADDQNQGPAEIEKMTNYIRQSVNTRFRKTGRGLMIGTRQAEMDVYKKLMEEGFFDHVLILPAVYPDGSTLWPERYTNEEYENWKTKAGPRVWALTYQQQDVVSEGQAFPMDLIKSAYDNSLSAQVIPEGSHVVIGIDPSAENYTAGVALAVNPKTKQRVIVDCWNEKGLVADGGDKREGVVQFILAMAETYKARSVVLEDNSSFTFVSSAPHLKGSLAEMGCQMETVKAGKYQYSDQAMSLVLSTLFANDSVKIPARGSSLTVYNDLIYQLASWRPNNKKLVRDLVRAFYYAAVAGTRLVESESVNYASQPGVPGFQRNLHHG